MHKESLLQLPIDEARLASDKSVCDGEKKKVLINGKLYLSIYEERLLLPKCRTERLRKLLSNHGPDLPENDPIK